MATPFKLKSGNASAFKNLGSSPAKQKPGGSVGEALEHHKAYKAKKSMPKNFNTTGSSKAGNIWQRGKDLAKKTFKGASKSNILALMLAPMSASADDQPKLKKGDTHYQDPKKKIDFSKKK
tara:strand:- start:36 stop:398 length:363 start_codon:yes stop_codon:yes gene_type:complete